MEEETQKQKEEWKRKHISFPANFLKEFKDFQVKEGFGSFSEMVRIALRFFKKQLGSQLKDQKEEKDFKAHLIRIEKRLDELTLERKLLENYKEEKNSEIEKIPPEELDLDFQKISQEILSTIEDPNMFNGQVKDFVIVDFFREKYSRGIIFYILTQLKNNKILTLENGVWKRI